MKKNISYEDEQVFLSKGSVNACYVFVFTMVDANEDIQGFTYDNGNQSTVSMTAIKLNNTIPNITAAISGAGWFDVPSGVTWDLLTISRVDTGGGVYDYTITFKNPKLNGVATDIFILSTGSQNVAATVTDCT